MDWQQLNTICGKGCDILDGVIHWMQFGVAVIILGYGLAWYDSTRDYSGAVCSSSTQQMSK